MSDTIVIPEWTLVDRLRKARTAAGFSQNELAAAAGFSRKTVTNAESGHAVPHPLTLRAWAEACNVPLAWLVGDADIRRNTGGELGLETYECAGQLDLLAA